MHTEVEEVRARAVLSRVEALVQFVRETNHRVVEETVIAHDQGSVWEKHMCKMANHVRMLRRVHRGQHEDQCAQLEQRGDIRDGEDVPGLGGTAVE